MKPKQAIVVSLIGIVVSLFGASLNAYLIYWHGKHEYQGTMTGFLFAAVIWTIGALVWNAVWEKTK